MIRSTDITSFSDFRAHLREHLTQRSETERPRFVTNNGQMQAVVLSPRASDELVEQAELFQSLKMFERSQEDIAAGRAVPAKDAIKSIADELGFKIDR